MSIKIKFDNVGNPIPPTLVLATRTGDLLGAINYYGMTFKESLTSDTEIVFRVSKYDNGVLTQNWDKIKDFALVWLPVYDKWYDISVEINEQDTTEKIVTGTALGVSELSQIMLYTTEINTENDIARDDYVPTVLYNENDPKGSLLNRITEKAPHYKIIHVDETIRDIQRTFTFDGVSIYDAFQTIAEEIHCLFLLSAETDDKGNFERTITVRDLESVCNNDECSEKGKRGEFYDKCPNCGSANITRGYGEDTSVFVSVDNLASNITYKTDVGSVKNCFKLTAGDDYMTATIMNCNPNGSGYLWYISDEQRVDMPEELSNKLYEYDTEYKRYQTDEKYVDKADVTEYNALVAKYNEIATTKNLSPIGAPVIGFSSFMECYYNTIDFESFLQNELMPENGGIDTTTAENECVKLGLWEVGSVAVESLTSASKTTVDSAVLAMAKTIVDSRYQVKIKESSYGAGTWEGYFSVTNYSDEEDTAETSPILIAIIDGDDNYLDFVKQKITRVLNGKTENSYDIVALFDSGEADFKAELKKYCLNSLNYFYEACQSCLDILIEKGITSASTDENSVNGLYGTYRNKKAALEAEISTRENEIKTVTDLITAFDKKRTEVAEVLDLETYLGSDLWKTLLLYRREDAYKNDNYISDGLTNAEIFSNAREFFEVATKDIIKSATLQHSISASLQNLLAMREFEPLVKHFEVGNWIRIRVNNSVYTLRLLDYEISFDELDSISVNFSDVMQLNESYSDIHSILSSAASMATTYGFVARQAGQGAKSNLFINNWVNRGLDATNIKIISNADNQDIVYDAHGLLAREVNPITGEYYPEQLKIINRGLYLTRDGWATASAGIGKFQHIDPVTGETSERYGVIADTVCANIVLTQNLGIYAGDRQITIDGNGIVINAKNGNKGNLFTIQKSESDKLLYVDTSGNLNIKGAITATSLSLGEITIPEANLDLTNVNSNIDKVDKSKVTVFTGSSVPTDYKLGDVWVRSASSELVCVNETTDTGKAVWVETKSIGENLMIASTPVGRANDAANLALHRQYLSNGGGGNINRLAPSAAYGLNYEISLTAEESEKYFYTAWAQLPFPSTSSSERYYTLSFMATSSNNPGLDVYIGYSTTSLNDLDYTASTTFRENGTDIPDVEFHPLKVSSVATADGWTMYAVKFKAPLDSRGYKSVCFRIDCDNKSSSMAARTLYITRIKLESGDYPSLFSHCPSDPLQTDILIEKGHVLATDEYGKLKGSFAPNATVTDSGSDNVTVKFDGDSTTYTVPKTGLIIADNAIIKGTIMSSNGVIGGWKITDKGLYYGDSTYPTVLISPTGMTYGNQTLGLKVGTNFAVDIEGKIFATHANLLSGKIGTADDSWTIDGYKIVGNNVGMSAMTGNDWAFWAGAVTGSDSPYHVGHDGTLFASSATITGTVTATSGNIAGFELSSNGFLGNGISLYNKNYGEEGTYFKVSAASGGTEYSFKLNYASSSGLSMSLVGEASFLGRTTHSNGLHVRGAVAATSTSGYYDGFIKQKGAERSSLGDRAACMFFGINTGSSDSNSAKIISRRSGVFLIAATSDVALTSNYSNENFGTAGLRTTSGGGALNGTWTATSAISVSSDINNKNSIEDIPDKYGLLFDNLTPVRYKYNDGKSNRYHTGFIAQSVESALIQSGLATTDFAGYVKATEVVTTDSGEEILDENGNTVIQEKSYLRYEEFIALNTYEIKKLKTRIAELESLVQGLRQN